MVEDLFRFLLVKGVEGPTEDTAEQTVVEVEHEDSVLCDQLRRFKKEKKPRGDYEALAKGHKESDVYISATEKLPVDLVKLERALRKCRGPLEKDTLKTIAKESLLQPKETDIAALVRSDDFKKLKARLVDSILALSVLPDSDYTHHDLLVRSLKIAHLLELSVDDKWPFHSKLDFADAMKRLSVLLPSDIFPLPRPILETKPEPIEKLKLKPSAKAIRVLEKKKKRARVKELMQAHSELTSLMKKPDIMQVPKVKKWRLRKKPITPEEMLPTTAKNKAMRSLMTGEPSLPVIGPLLLKSESYKSLSKSVQKSLASLGYHSENTSPLDALESIELEISILEEELTEPTYGFMIGSFIVKPEPIAAEEEEELPPDAASLAAAAGEIDEPTAQPPSAGESPDAIPRDEAGVQPDGPGMFYYSGIGDLMIVRQELKAYELGDFAHVENVLAGEYRERKHRRLDITEEEMRVLEEYETESERDLQSTERNEIQIEAERTIAQEVNVEGSLTASYHGPTVDITTSASGGIHRQTTSSSRRASNFSQEVIQRTLDRLRHKEVKERRLRKVREIEETNLHGVNNAHPDAEHIRGVYRWLNKIYDAQVYNLGRRHMFDFIIPEPAAFYIYAIEKSRSANSIPIPKEPNFGPKHLKWSNWRAKVKEYGAVGVSSPPGRKTFYFGKAESSRNVSHYTNSGKIAIDDGWEAYAVSVRSNWCSYYPYPYPSQEIFVADSLENNRYWNLATHNYHRNEMGVAQWAFNIAAYTFKVDVLCQPTKEAKAQWQLETYEAIMEGYRQQLSEYEEKLKAAQKGEGLEIPGRNPERNKQIIKEELQRCCLTLLARNYFEHYNCFLPVAPDPSTMTHPYLMNFDRTKEHSLLVRFLQHAFEWENMTYIFYPHFWGRRASWVSRLIEFEDPDPNLAAFLQSGAARVQVPVREGFGEAVLRYAQTLEIPLNEELTMIGSELYVDAVTEVKESLGSLDDAAPVGDTWEVRVPTSLVVLQDADEILFRDPLLGGTDGTVTLGFNKSVASSTERKLPPKEP